MKRGQFFAMLLIGILALAWSVQANDTPKENWDLFSKNLVMALKSQNEGLQRSAMMRIIQHADKVKVDAAVYDVVRIYRSHSDENMRQLALVTLYKMDNKWAIDFLKRAAKFEKSPKLRKQIYAILNEYAMKTALADDNMEFFADNK